MRKIPSLLAPKLKIRQKSSRAMGAPDLTIFFSNEVAEWDKYLTSQFENNCAETTTIAHENLKDLSFPLSPRTIRNFSARVVLIIISPAFLDFLCHNYEDAVEVGKQLKPERTVAILCGVQENDVTSFHKEVLVSYDSWFHLVVKDRDLSAVRNVIENVQNLLRRFQEVNSHSFTKPGFKFVPRKIQPGNGKVYIILDKPTTEEEKRVKVFLEVKGMTEVAAKYRNPYNYHFTVPDNCMQFTSLLKVHVYHGEDLIGISQLKCESKMGELYRLLSTNNSPYELMCTTLGLASLYDVDEHMAKAFRKLMPSSGLSFLQAGETVKWKKSKEELPTLLHFAARYGLSQLTKEILSCPGAFSACYMKNDKDLNPAQLASHHGHNDVARILTEFQKTLDHFVKNQSFADSQGLLPDTYQLRKTSLEGYDFPPSNPTCVCAPHPITGNNKDQQCREREEYLKMVGSMNSEAYPVEQQNLSVLETQPIKVNLSASEQEKVKLPPSSHSSEVDFLRSQSKLAEIMKAYKKGASLLEVERMQNEWKSTFQVSDTQAKQTLESLRNMYAKAQKSKLNKKQSSSFSELRQFIGSKLRRKDSVSSKGSDNWPQDKVVHITETFESDVRPMSTLSLTSNTSSSSGSSFDAVSSISAGSDSGNHSDNCDDKSHLKNLPSWKSLACSEFSKNALLNNKPPAPPPRPAKTYVKPNAVPHQNGSTSNIASSHLTSLQCKFDYVLPDPDISYVKKCHSISSGMSDPLDNYDIPPVPRPHDSNSLISSVDTFEYDLVPPPLPLSSKPGCSQESSDAQLYDIPLSVPTLVSDYDFPKTFDSPVHKNSSFNLLEVLENSKTSKIPENSIDFMKNRGEIVRYALLSKCQSVLTNDAKPNSPYCNIFISDIKEVSSDKIPDEIAPKPPIIEEPEEEYYKMVGTPVPVSMSDVNVVN